MYKELSDDHQRRVSAFLDKYAFFAFNDKQFKQGLQKLGIAEADAGKALARMGSTGGFMLQDKTAEYCALAESITKETEAAAHDPVTGPQFAFEMFYYELANHEYSYTGRVSDALDALGYTLDEVIQDDILNTALAKACKAVLQDAE